MPPKDVDRMEDIADPDPTTVKILKIQTSKKFAVITLKFEQQGFTIE